MMVGAFRGTGANIDIKTVGFRPKVVKLYNETGNCQAVWLESMADGEMQKTVDSGTNLTDISKVTTTGITPLSNGFRLGTDADLNVSAELVHWEAIA